MGSLVSLVMSDIVDSTRRWNAAEGAMAADLELHDRLIRDVVEGAGGSVFKHTGDGMIAVFDDPVAAVGAAASIQRTFGDTAWQHTDGLQVRAAVHSGVVYPRDGDLFGTAVNRVARLLAACPPGAVLVSGATTGLLTDRAPEGLTLRPIGPVALAGFATPDDAHAAVGVGLAEVSNLREAAAEPVVSRMELPPIHEELVGRVDELAIVWNALGRAQLLTLVGVGGMGKTRLALEIAAGAVAAYDGAVWWIDLANATSSEAVVPVAMAAVGARETPGRTALQSLCDRFVGVAGLVVVDNCEHVLVAAKAMVDALRTAAPSLKVVCTSREALGLRGEHIVPIGALPADDGVALFNERAIAVRPDLDTATDSDVIQRLCARLDGIPLAIELAAARCRSMTPAEIDTRLGDRFRLLRGGRDGTERHRTLQAAVAWSYSLLDDDERTVFDQMATFAGGTLIDGLVAVTGYDEYDLLDIVDRLVARSMVVATRTPLGTRYHQLETLRQYAEDRLVEAGTITDTRNRHLDWVRELAGHLADAHGIDAEAAAFARFATEVDNLRVAVAHALDQGRTDTAQEVVALSGGYAWWTTVWEVLDWVRPFPDDHEWDPISAVCASLGSVADTQRRPGNVSARSVDDVPPWYSAAPTSSKISFVFNHTLCGGEPFIATALLDRLEPTNDAERAQIAGQRLLVGMVRQVRPDGVLTPEEHAEFEQAAASATALARRSGRAGVLAVVAANSADYLLFREPHLAATYASEALDIAERLGARLLAAYAERALLDALTRSSPSRDVMITLRDRTLAAIERNQPYLAVATISGAMPFVAQREPDVAVRLWLVGKRDHGVDSRRRLEEAGVTIPADLDELERTLATTSLIDVTREMLAALERSIAAADTDTEADRGGGS